MHIQNEDEGSGDFQIEQDPNDEYFQKSRNNMNMISG